MKALLLTVIGCALLLGIFYLTSGSDVDENVTSYTNAKAKGAAVEALDYTATKANQLAGELEGVEEDN